MQINKLADENYFHFSVDDVFIALIQATLENEYLFDNKFFKFLSNLHTEYGVNIDLYLFFESQYESKIYTLEDISDRFKYELQNAQWLKFGPHALNSVVAPYQQTAEQQVQLFEKIYNQIDRFAGEEKYSTTLRLHCFSESYHLKKYWQQRKVNTLLLTDKSAVSYHLPKSARRELGKSGELNYDNNLKLRRSQFRMENLVDINPIEIQSLLLDKILMHGYLNLFTHEYELINPQVREKCHYCINESKSILSSDGHFDFLIKVARSIN